ncbi:MAG: sensor histidine kinase [Thermomicrobiales bacterium]
MGARRIGFFGSIRFRLAAWCMLAILAVLVAVGFALPMLMERQLRSDVDERLRDTARTILDRGNIVSGSVSLPNPNPIASPGQVVQVIHMDGVLVQETGGSNGVILPATPYQPGDEGPAFLTASVEGGQVRTIRWPIVGEISRQTFGILIVGESLEPVDRSLENLRKLLLVGSIPGVALAAAGGWFLAGRLLGPVNRITAAASGIATERATAQSLATRLDVPDTRDELARLAATFNQMLDQIEQAFSTQRRFIADASHELRTPLTAIRGNIDVLLRQAKIDEMPSRDDTIEALDDVRREAARMARLLGDLLTLARADSPVADGSRREPVALDAVARDAVTTARALSTGQLLTLDAPERVTVLADPDRMQQLLLILLENAIRHTPSDGEIAVSVSRIDGQAHLTVSDSGEGIAQEHIPHLFDRFYRADTARGRARGGTGLGLAIARAIARGHGGEIDVSSIRGEGSAFTVTIPMVPTRTPVSPRTLPAPTATVSRRDEGGTS